MANSRDGVATVKRRRMSEERRYDAELSGSEMAARRKRGRQRKRERDTRARIWIAEIVKQCERGKEKLEDMCNWALHECMPQCACAVG